MPTASPNLASRWPMLPSPMMPSVLPRRLGAARRASHPPAFTPRSNAGMPRANASMSASAWSATTWLLASGAWQTRTWRACAALRSIFQNPRQSSRSIPGRATSPIHQRSSPSSRSSPRRAREHGRRRLPAPRDHVIVRGHGGQPVRVQRHPGQHPWRTRRPALSSVVAFMTALCLLKSCDDGHKNYHKPFDLYTLAVQSIHIGIIKHT